MREEDAGGEDKEEVVSPEDERLTDEAEPVTAPDTEVVARETEVVDAPPVALLDDVELLEVAAVVDSLAVEDELEPELLSSPLWTKKLAGPAPVEAGCAKLEPNSYSVKVMAVEL